MRWIAMMLGLACVGCSAARLDREATLKQYAAVPCEAVLIQEQNGLKVYRVTLNGRVHTCVVDRHGRVTPVVTP